MENITRNIIADLYPLYISGDASADSRRLVETFLAQDEEFARTLKDGAGDMLAIYPPSLSPDHELKTLAKIKRHLSGPIWLLQLALIMSGLAFGRIVSDTSFDVSPRKFIVTAVIAIGFWVAFFVKLWLGRRPLMLRPR